MPSGPWAGAALQPGSILVYYRCAVKVSVETRIPRRLSPSQARISCSGPYRRCRRVPRRATVRHPPRMEPRTAPAKMGYHDVWAARRRTDRSTVAGGSWATLEWLHQPWGAGASATYPARRPLAPTELRPSRTPAAQVRRARAPRCRFSAPWKHAEYRLYPRAPDDVTGAYRGARRGGMDIAQLNFSHGDEADHEQVYRTVREVADEAGAARRDPGRHARTWIRYGRAGSPAAPPARPRLPRRSNNSSMSLNVIWASTEPRRGAVTISPSASSSGNASRIGIRDTFNRSDSSRSNNREPGTGSSVDDRVLQVLVDLLRRPPSPPPGIPIFLMGYRLPVELPSRQTCRQACKVTDAASGEAVCGSSSWGLPRSSGRRSPRCRPPGTA